MEQPEGSVANYGESYDTGGEKQPTGKSEFSNPSLSSSLGEGSLRQSHAIYSPGWPGNHYVFQSGLELALILLPQSLEY